jgi:hypothetical protein
LPLPLAVLVGPTVGALLTELEQPASSSPPEIRTAGISLFMQQLLRTVASPAPRLY